MISLLMRQHVASAELRPSVQAILMRLFARAASSREAASAAASREALLVLLSQHGARLFSRLRDDNSSLNSFIEIVISLSRGSDSANKALSALQSHLLKHVK